jgi:hypothetical protein
MKYKLFLLALISFLTYSCSTDEGEFPQGKIPAAKTNKQSDVKNLTNKMTIDSIKISSIEVYVTDGEPSNPIPPRKN